MTIYDFFDQAVLHHEKYVTDTLCEELPESFYDTIQDALQLIKDSSMAEIENK